jgi:hypothetical protein
MIAMSTIHNVASIGWDILHEMNVHHELVGCIAYDSCINTSYIPMLFARIENVRNFLEN